MSTINLKSLASDLSQSLEQPTVLFKDNGHAIYWLGIPEETAFRCNTYLIVDNEEAIIVDPGNRNFFNFVVDRVRQILPPKQVNGMILCHQDPDVAGSMVDWLNMNPDMKVITSMRTNVLLPHYGTKGYTIREIEENYTFSSGRELQFITAPFLHFPGAFTTYDLVAEFLFSGDIWAALDTDWKLVVEDFASHIMKLNLFHLDYMPCNRATRGFAESLEGIPLKAILPQHGSIISEEDVHAALEYLENLQCGLDFIYPASL